MLEAIYELPSRQDVAHCHITREMVEKRSSDAVLLHPTARSQPA